MRLRYSKNAYERYLILAFTCYAKETSLDLDDELILLQTETSSESCQAS